MSKPKNQSTSLISSTFRFAKKISSSGLNLLDHVAPNSIARLKEKPAPEQVLDGESEVKSQFEQAAKTQLQYQQPQQMLRAHLPTVSKQLLGKHYQKMHYVGSFISPQFNDIISDYLFEHLNDAVSKWSSTETILNQTGVKQLSELTLDPARSERVTQALANQNRIWAATQGGITGLMGVIGAAVDVPCSMALALRGIYQTGRAYGFELTVVDQSVVEYVFKHIDFASVAEKQAVLAVIRSTQQMLSQHDIKQLQQLLGSTNDAEFLIQFLFDDQGQLKWTWLRHIPQFKLLSKLTYVASAGVGAVYSYNLVDQTTQHADLVFSQARQYLIDHPEKTLDPLSAYLAAVELSQRKYQSLQIQAEQENIEQSAVAAQSEQKATDHAPALAQKVVAEQQGQQSNTPSKVSDPAESISATKKTENLLTATVQTAATKNTAQKSTAAESSPVKKQTKSNSTVRTRRTVKSKVQQTETQDTTAKSTQPTKATKPRNRTQVKLNSNATAQSLERDTKNNKN